MRSQIPPLPALGDRNTNGTSRTHLPVLMSHLVNPSCLSLDLLDRRNEYFLTFLLILIFSYKSSQEPGQNREGECKEQWMDPINPRTSRPPNSTETRWGSMVISPFPLYLGFCCPHQAHWCSLSFDRAGISWRHPRALPCNAQGMFRSLWGSHLSPAAALLPFRV